MKTTEIYFNKSGETIIGNYSTYRELDKAIESKSVPRPFGYVIKGEVADIRRLTEHVQLFGNCIRRLAGWQKACELSGVSIEVSR